MRSSHRSDFSCCRALALGRAGFRSCSPWDLEHRIGSCGARAFCSMTCGIFPDQGSNPCLLHWQADSLPLSHLGSSLIATNRLVKAMVFPVVMYACKSWTVKKAEH